eukprot:TRINITY_DN6618_c0_g1_i1.p1 TRINITY_DN6618_c0_g1~~TRINITY_DN6618_c0_g1_i1.p1  ORF type:complete len:474 (+),score=91.37 TRINITY_DN6618_c0_g1_i1:358-1779(+)
MKEDCVKPNIEHYRALIYACGKRGYAKKSMELFRSFKDRGLPQSQALYSDLFHSLYNSPYPEHALRSAHALKRSLPIKPNPILANNMIKTFGKLGELQTAFDIADETLCNVDTVNHLLSACLSDKESGFRHALVLWRRFLVEGKRKHVQPNLSSFSLLLRITQECSLGDQKTWGDLLLESMSVNQVQALADGEKRPEIRSNEGEVPNLLQPIVNFDGVVGLSQQLETPLGRFSAIGSLKGFLDSMASHSVTPNIKIYTQILTLLPSNTEIENVLLAYMDEGGLQPDIGFFNVLIKKRSTRRDFKGAREDALKEIFRRGLEPEVRTYGILAMTCHKSCHMHSLVRDMKNSGIRLNNEILGALLSRPISNFHISDIIFLLKLSRRSKLKISPRVLSKVENFQLTFKREVLKYERSESTHPCLAYHIQNKFSAWETFQKEYKVWLRSVHMESTEHEWKQFLTSAEENNPGALDKMK